MMVLMGHGCCHCCQKLNIFQVAGVKPEYRKYYDKVFSLENEAPEEAYPLKYKDFQAKLNFSRFLTDEEVVGEGMRHL